MLEGLASVFSTQGMLVMLFRGGGGNRLCRILQVVKVMHASVSLQPPLSPLLNDALGCVGWRFGARCLES